MNYDAVVIGAGHNGLRRPSGWREAWRVAVVEGKDTPGGAVKTREMTLPGFRHDIAAMNLSMFAGSPFFQAHKETLLWNGLGFRPGRRLFRQRVSRRLLSRRQQDPGDDAGADRRRLAGDAEAWKAMLQRFGAEAPHIFALLGSTMPSPAAIGAVWRALRQRARAGSTTC